MSNASLATAQQQFESALPAILTTARYVFRNWTWQDREEALAETRAEAWSAWRGLVKRGKDPRDVGIAGIARNACRHVRSGRRFGSSRRGRGAMDVWHPRFQQRTGLRIFSLDVDDETGHSCKKGAWKEWIAFDNCMSPADKAAFRLDFECWLKSLPGRKRRMAELLRAGHTTGEVARQLKVTAPAVSQARLWLANSWRQFQGES